MPGLLSTAIRGAAAGKMAGMLEISSVRGGVTHCLPRSVVIGTAAPGILVLAARGFPGAVLPSDVYEGMRSWLS